MMQEYNLNTLIDGKKHLAVEINPAKEGKTGTHDIRVKCGRRWYVVRTFYNLASDGKYSLYIRRDDRGAKPSKEYLGCIVYRGTICIDRLFVENFQKEAEVYHAFKRLVEDGMGRCDLGKAVL